MNCFSRSERLAEKDGLKLFGSLKANLILCMEFLGILLTRTWAIFSILCMASISGVIENCKLF